MDRINTRKALMFEKPDYIPVRFAINDSCWSFYSQEALLELILEHGFLFPDFVCPKLPVTPRYTNVAKKLSLYR